jgi:glycosyltransferase involved in cell wall biosynthesis
VVRTPNASVIICTHNPRADYLARVLGALREQTLPKEQWELLLIDNCSREPLASWNLSWHPRARIVREEELGLTAARLRGIRESKGDPLVFIDDDNLLSPEYLTESLRIGGAYAFLGAWGGQVIPEFEEQPTADVCPFLRYLLIRKFDEIKWSNTINFHETTPCGAGMCIRRAVSDEYASLLASDPRRKELDRKGELIFAGGDSDMALCSRRLGLGTGLFPSLKLDHLIPENRVKRSFFLKAAFGGGYSFTLLDYLHGLKKNRPKVGIVRRSARFARTLGRSPFERRLAAEEKKGESLAWNLIERWERRAE